jgi:thioesterase domain-containing protein
MNDPTTSRLQTLHQIWMRVFRRSAIAATDDFFALGGDTWLAAELFSHINHEFGLQLSPATICNAPSIAALAVTLDNPPPSGPAIQLKNDGNSAPTFIFHGIGGSVIDLVPLVRRMQSGQAVYGLEIKGNDGREGALDRVEDIAHFFLPAIREIQPHGPYCLIGYSFGGLVALEIAQRLKAEAEKIGLLVMLDSYPDRRYLSFAQYFQLLLQLVGNRLSPSTNAGAGQKREFVDTYDREPSSLVHALERVKAAQYRALRNYRPRFYDGELWFVRAATPSRFPADPIPVWSPLVRRLEVETVPGEHLDMLTISVDQTASILDRHVLGSRKDSKR